MYRNETSLLNFFVYTALAENRSQSQKSSKDNLEVIKNTLPNKRGNPESLKK